jgi:hypothetical protein
LAGVSAASSIYSQQGLFLAGFAIIVDALAYDYNNVGVRAY